MPKGKNFSRLTTKSDSLVNGVARGAIWNTAYSIDVSGEEVETLSSDPTLGRPEQPDEIGPSYVFLVSGNSSYMTGQILQSNGGTAVNG